MTETEVKKEIQQLPYHYVESAQGYIVAGWKLPKRWKFEFYALLDLLCAQQDWLRIKGIFNTDQGWKVLTLILISLIISLVKRALITVLKSLADITMIGWLLKQHYLPVSLKNREHQTKNNSMFSDEWD